MTWNFDEYSAPKTCIGLSFGFKYSAHINKQTVTLQVALNTTTTEDDVLFGRNPLEIGRQLTLDLGQVTVKGTVTKLRSDS